MPVVAVQAVPRHVTFHGMSPSRIVKPMSSEDYLRTEEASPVKREYVRGRVRALAGTTDRHNRLVLKLAARLLDAEAGECRVYASDVRLRVAEDLYYYPDIMVVCEDDPHPLQKTRACLVIEVLSPSTRSTDLVEKRMAYTSLRSLEAYIVFDVDRPRAAGFFRTPSGFEERRWEGTGTIELPCAGIAVGLEGLYGGL